MAESALRETQSPSSLIVIHTQSADSIFNFNDVAIETPSSESADYLLSASVKSYAPGEFNTCSDVHTVRHPACPSPDRSACIFNTATGSDARSMPLGYKLTCTACFDTGAAIDLVVPICKSTSCLSYHSHLARVELSVDSDLPRAIEKEEGRRRHTGCAPIPNLFDIRVCFRLLYSLKAFFLIVTAPHVTVPIHAR